MRKKNQILLSMTLVLFFLQCLLVNNILYSQNNKNDQKLKENNKPVQTNIVPEQNEENEPNILIAPSAGYFLPFGDMAKYLYGNWTVKLMAQYSDPTTDIPNLGIEFGYAGLPDKDKPNKFKITNQGIHYIFMVPYYPLIFSFFSLFDVQIQLGAGVTVLYSRVIEMEKLKTKTVPDFTLKAGFGISKTIKKHYVLGIDGSLYYFFEKKAGISLAFNMFFGYKF